MMLPTELAALADARREEFEREMRIAHQLAAVTPRTPGWRRWTGSAMMWTGARLVNWGEGVAVAHPTRRYEIAN